MVTFENTRRHGREQVRGGLTTVRKLPQGASARTRRGRSARWHNPTNKEIPLRHKIYGVKEIPLRHKIYGVKEIPEKTSQSVPHPRDPRKSRKKPHNLSAIPGIPENPGKNLTILRICLVGCCWWLAADKLCRGPLRGQKCAPQLNSY